MKIRLHRLSSEPQLFEPISFSHGINLILGEKWDENQPQGRKENGVGKSLCVEFLHFALLREFGKTRVSLIPGEIFPDGFSVVLDLSINGEELQIRRSLARPEQPTILRGGKSTTFATLEHATRFLGDLLFAGTSDVGFNSFRGLMSLLMRDERSGFSDILNAMAVKRNGAPPDPQPHLFLLGIDVGEYRRLLDAIRELDRQTKLLTKLKEDLTRRGAVRMGDIAAELNQDQAVVQKIEDGLAELRAEPAFAQVEADLNQLEGKLAALRARRKGVDYQIDQIRVLPKPETIDETDIAIVFNRVRAGLGDLVIKSLEQAKAFKDEIESFQRSLLNEELQRLESEHEKLTQQIRELSREHSTLVARVDRRGVLDELRSGLLVAQAKQQDYYHRRALFQQYGEAEQRKEDLKSERQLAMDALRHQILEQRVVEASMNQEVADIHARVMHNRNASFSIKVLTGANVKHPLDFALRIQDDGSHSVNRTKVFIYDSALMFASCTQDRHPGFLLHDNIFDVDQDTLVQCLNFLQEKLEDGADFQYILTLNREKIENEDRRNMLKFNVDEVRKARLTKDKPFLGVRYQEKARQPQESE